MNFTFITEDGTKTLSYPAYLADWDLREKINDRNRVRVLLGSTIISYDPKFLILNPKTKLQVDALVKMQDENPLQFYCPSGQGVTEFLNDTESSLKILLAGNRKGKTASSVIDILLDAVPCNENWTVFKNNGVKFRPWRGPIRCGFASTDWTVMQRVLWNELKKWLPKAEFGKNRDYEPSWNRNPHMELACGTTFYFYVYEQKQGVFEGQVVDRFYWDEQGEEAKFDGADERTRTVKGRHVFGMTPHKVEGRPDTGARSWIHKMVTGEQTRGHNLKVYNIFTEDVPDWIYPESEKEKSYVKWIKEPMERKDFKMLKEGMSRHYGKWHDSGGLVFDEWSDEVHLVDPFKIPDSWPRYRTLDHGTVNPTACLCGAVDPDGDLYLYDEYEESGKSIYENVRAIVEKVCGNKLVEDGMVNVKGFMFPRFVEKNTKQIFLQTRMDSRSCAKTDDNTFLTLDKLYAHAGLRVMPASGSASAEMIAIAKQLLLPDYTKIHPYTKKEGKPKIFVFRTLKNFVRELRGWGWQEASSAKVNAKSNASEKPINKDNHLMDAFLYMVTIPPRYVKGRWAFGGGYIDEEEDEDERKVEFHDRYTGY